MNATTTTNQPLTTIVLILLIIPLSQLVIGIVAGFRMLGGGMMGMMNIGGMTLAPGAHLPDLLSKSDGLSRTVPGSAGMSNDVTRACTDMMQNSQGR